MWSSAWRCDLHGEISPLAPARLPSRDGLLLLASHTTVPVWLPWPLPAGWLVSGFTGAGDERTGARASAVALSGPNPLGGPADLLIVAEEPGVGLGPAWPGCPGPTQATGSPTGRRTPPSGWPTTMRRCGWWSRPGRPCSSARWRASWVWLVLWPDTAGALLVEPLALRDLRDPEQDLRPPFGALCTRLPA